MGFFLECLGAAREVGRSAILLQTDKRIMLDYGIKIYDPSGKPQYPLEEVIPDFAVISHAHLDHSGFVPAFYKKSNIRWFSTPPTKDLCEVLWKDSMKIMGEQLPYRLKHYKKALKYWSPMAYGNWMRTGETNIQLHDAGHISGAAIIEIKHKNKKICYTGDFKMEETCMHRGAKPMDDVDVLVIESTYSDRDHPPRAELEREMAREIKETLDQGGNVLLPSFSLGRTQELISIVRKHNRNVPIFVDGMGRELTKIYLRYSRYIKDIKKFRHDASSVTMVQGMKDRMFATRKPSVIISSAGMLNGGPALQYLFNLKSRSKVIFTGFCMQDTNGWKLQNEGYVTKDDEDLYIDMPIEYLDFSAHAGRKDLLKFINKANPEKVVLVHGEKPDAFAEELREGYGYDAVAPILGERIMID